MRVLLTALTCPKGEIGTNLASHLELVGADAGRPFITELLASDGDVVTVHRKAGLATDEGAHLHRGLVSEPVSVAGVSACLAFRAEIGTDPPYAQGSTLVLGPAAPGLYGGAAPHRRGLATRRRLVAEECHR